MLANYDFVTSLILTPGDKERPDKVTGVWQGRTPVFRNIRWEGGDFSSRPGPYLKQGDSAEEQSRNILLSQISTMASLPIPRIEKGRDESRRPLVLQHFADAKSIAVLLCGSTARRCTARHGSRCTARYCGRCTAGDFRRCTARHWLAARIRTACVPFLELLEHTTGKQTVTFLAAGVATRGWFAASGWSTT